MTDIDPSVAEVDWDTLAFEVKDYAVQVEKLRWQLAEERERREINLNAEQPSEEELMLCDSSFKKNNGLIRKLKVITLKDKDGLCAEIEKVNQTKYVSEVVAAIVENPMKGKDITAAVEICSRLHRRYADFSLGLKEALTKAYVARHLGEDAKTTGFRRRSCLRMIMELYFAGLFDGLHLLNRIIKDLSNAEHDKDPEMYIQGLTLLTSIAKIGRMPLLHLSMPFPFDLSRFPHPSEDDPEDAQIAWAAAERADTQLKEEIGKQFRVGESDAAEFLNCLKRSADRSFETVLSEHKKLRDLENENTNVLNAKGELPENLATDYETKRQAFETLQRTVSSFAECMDLTMPPLPEDKIARMGGSIVQVSTTALMLCMVMHQVIEMTDDQEAHPLYDDAETREFYEVLPDLRSTVPPVLLGIAEDKDDMKSPKATAEPEHDPKSPKSSEDPSADDETSKELKQKSSTIHKKMDALLQRLKNCYTRDGADEIATDFCYINSKSTRKRLIRALCDVPKGCLPLIPFYARITATLNQVFTDVASGLALQLESDFNAFMAKKDPGTHSLEARITNMRYMGELCKFKLINYGTVFTCLKRLLDDFTHMNIDAACALIETSGRYLVRLPETQGRMENRLDQMNRLKNAKNLDSRHRAAIDNAYFQCKPPKSGIRRKRRPSIHEYIRHLIFTVLTDETIIDVLKKLRGLSWDQHESFVVHCMLKANVKLYAHIPLVASLCSGLAKYNDSLAVNVVDSVFEEIQLGMEHPGTGLYQHRVAHVRFLGELYNYRVIDSKTVFDTLYWILSFGRSTPEEMHKLDPPGDAFRIKMVCTILETCGRYFGKGSARKKMDRFLIYFQRYILSKPPLSMDIEFQISDTFEQLRPELHRYTSFEEANAAVDVIEAEMAIHDDAGRSGSEAEEESIEDIQETDASVESMEYDDDDDIDQERKPVVAETDAEFEQGLQALLQEHQRLTTADIKPVDELGNKDDRNVEKMPFKVLLKKGGKDDKSRKLDVPMSVTMAIRQKEHDTQEAADRTLIKERVLAAHEKDEEEELLNAGFLVRPSRSNKGRYDGSDGAVYGGRRYRRR